MERRRRAWWRLGVALVLGVGVGGWTMPVEAQGKGGAVIGAADAEDAGRLNQVVLTLLHAGKYEEALPLAQRALAIREKALGPEHPDVATSLNNLAELYRAKGEYARAEPLYVRGLAIAEKALGPDHPDVATSLNNLAALLDVKGEYGLAEPLYRRALAIREKVLGPDHRDVATVLQNLAGLYWASGRLPDAVQALTRAADVHEKALGRLVATGSEAQKLAFLESYAGDSSTAATLALQTHDAQAARLAELELLRRKGRALDVMAGALRALHARLDPQDQMLFDDLQTARSEYAALSLRGPALAPLDAHRQNRAALEERIRRLEEAVSQRSAAFAAEEQPVSMAAVQAALPDDAALVEWIAYHPFEPRARSRKERWGPTRYAASVLSKRGDPAWVDLGDAPRLARALEAKVMAPVRALLGETRHVFVSPDGALDLVPFAALVGDDGRPLLERYAFT